jgi:competence protein CoiA
VLYAKSEGGAQIRAGLAITEARCPHCGAPMLAKCGELVSWHWAHRARLDCDPWAEEETEWHRAWKALFPPERVEVTIGSHRADVVTPGGVIEFQHSPISPREIREREQHYGRMVWVFDASEFRRNLELRRRPGNQDPKYRTFRWRWPRKTLAAVKAPLYFDLDGRRMFRVRRLHLDSPAGGWGRLGTTAEFLAHYREREQDGTP